MAIGDQTAASNCIGGILSVEAPKHADLYDDILRAHAKTLVPIRVK